MTQFILISVALLIGGLVVGGFVTAVIWNWIDDVAKAGIVMILGALVLAPTGYFLSKALQASYIYFAFLFVSGVLLFLPSVLLINIWLLWWNPRKYKEYEMKKRQRDRELRRDDD